MASSKTSFSPADLRKAREKKGLSRVALADLLGASPSSVSNWERGKAVPVGENLRLVMKFISGKKITPPTLTPFKPAKIEFTRPTFEPKDLKAYRKKHKLSQQALADQLLVSLSTIGLWEAGTVMPNGLNLARVNRLLGKK